MNIVINAQFLIVVGYFVLIIGVGIYSQKRATSSDQFFGAGLGVLMCVCAGTGEWLGGTSTTGISEYGFVYGLSGAWYTIANAIGVLVLALFFAKLYRSIGTVTVPGIVERFIGVDARVISSVLLSIVMVAVGTSQVIAAGTLGVGVLGVPFEWSVIVLGIGFILYTLAGGMVAVGYTNIIHLVVMYGGILLAIVYTFFLLGDNNFVAGATALRQLPDSYFQMHAIGYSKVSSWLIASILGACTAQAGIQPILAAKNVKVARKSAFLTALVVAPFGIFTALLGMAAKVHFGDQITNGKEALPLLMMQLPPVVGGLVLAAIFAAILSTVSPIILAAGTMVTKDIYQRIINPGASDKKVLFYSRVFTGISGVLCILIALGLYGNTRVLDIVYSAYSLRGAIFVVLLFAIYWNRTTPKGAAWSLVITGATLVFWVGYHAVTGNYPIPGVTETYAAVLVAVLATIACSLAFREGSRRSQGLPNMAKKIIADSEEQERLLLSNE